MVVVCRRFVDMSLCISWISCKFMLCFIKQSLHHNKLAQCMPACGDILAFVDIHRYTLKFIH